MERATPGRRHTTYNGGRTACAAEHIARHSAAWVWCLVSGALASGMLAMKDPTLHADRALPHLHRDWARPSHICAGTGAYKPYNRLDCIECFHTLHCVRKHSRVRSLPSRDLIADSIDCMHHGHAPPLPTSPHPGHARTHPRTRACANTHTPRPSRPVPRPAPPPSLPAVQRHARVPHTRYLSRTARSHAPTLSQRAHCSRRAYVQHLQLRTQCTETIVGRWW